jgi:hypothetical protein
VFIYWKDKKEFLRQNLYCRETWVPGVNHRPTNKQTSASTVIHFPSTRIPCPQSSCEPYHLTLTSYVSLLSLYTKYMYHTHFIMLYTSPWSRFERTTSVAIDTDCIGSRKSNYQTITATMAPCSGWIILIHLNLQRKLVMQQDCLNDGWWPRGYNTVIYGTNI